MVFDPEVAAAAQRWAEKMNRSGQMKHANESESNGCGENLAWNSNRREIQNTNQASQSWYDEVTNPGYDFNNGGYYENRGTGHFTQMVWKNSYKLGCGISGEYVACRYCEKSGNYIGEFKQNVFSRGPPATCTGQPPSNAATNPGARNNDNQSPFSDPYSPTRDPWADNSNPGQGSGGN